MISESLQSSWFSFLKGLWDLVLSALLQSQVKTQASVTQPVCYEISKVPSQGKEEHWLLVYVTGAARHCTARQQNMHARKEAYIIKLPPVFGTAANQKCMAKKTPVKHTHKQQNTNGCCGCRCALIRTQRVGTPSLPKQRNTSERLHTASQSSSNHTQGRQSIKNKAFFVLYLFLCLWSHSNRAKCLSPTDLSLN